MKRLLFFALFALSFSFLFGAGGVQNITVNGDTYMPGQEITVNFEYSVGTGGNWISYGVIFSDTTYTAYTDDAMVTAAGIYNSTLPNPDTDGHYGAWLGQILDTNWHSYAQAVTVPAGYTGTKYVHVLVKESGQYSYFSEPSDADANTLVAMAQAAHTATVTATVTETITATITETVTSSITATITETVTPSVTSSITATITETATPSVTASITQTVTVTVTASVTQTITPAVEVLENGCYYVYLYETTGGGMQQISSTGVFLFGYDLWDLTCDAAGNCLLTYNTSAMSDIVDGNIRRYIPLNGCGETNFIQDLTMGIGALRWPEYYDSGLSISTTGKTGGRLLLRDRNN